MQRFTYFQNSQNMPANTECTGSARLLHLHDRTGIHATSVHTRLRLDQHTLNEPCGGISMWILPLEDFSSTAQLGHIQHHEEFSSIWPLMTDIPESRRWHEATFAWIWASHWYPQFWAKFYKGNIYGDAYEPPRAMVGAGHFHFHRLHWYQLWLTWDKPNHQYRLYANGILVATCNQLVKPLEYQTIGSSLFIGEPTFAFGQISFFDHCPTSGEIQQHYRQQATQPDLAVDKALAHTFADADPQVFDWKPDISWQLQFESTLTQEKDLSNFYVQGNTNAPSITPEGLLIKTPIEPPEKEDRTQVYLWTRRWFDGHLALEFEFKPTRESGLSLLMLQANGMHREDFMADYPLRTTGSMAMVYGENVRNYHWEFFRGMDDTRNDVASNGLIKQPWNQPLAYHCSDKPLAMNQWHRLQFVQEGPRLRGAINGRIVFDVQDNPWSFTGGFYTAGHLAIRCMYKTRNFYRNLKIWTQPIDNDLKVTPCFQPA